MKLPKLQVASDQSTVHEAIKAVVEVGDVVDVLEEGTVLMCEVGSDIVRIIRELYPDTTIVADTKCADAGSTIVRNFKNKGANIMTCICSA